eukprot:SAG11_NODE_36341_length_262_cov_0.625767_1_plen_43_part_00
MYDEADRFPSAPTRRAVTALQRIKAANVAASSGTNLSRMADL